MKYSVIGDANQSVIAELSNGDEIHGDVAMMVLLTDGVALEPAYFGASHDPSRLQELNAPVPLTHFRCMSSLGVVGFSARCCGVMRKLELHGKSWICARDALLFCTRDVVSTIGIIHPCDNAYFRAKGCVFYRLSGHGDAFIHCGGSSIEYDLAPGQRVSAEIGCVAAFEDTVKSGVELVEGLPAASGEVSPVFLMTLTGPGKIYLATLPLSRVGGK